MGGSVNALDAICHSFHHVAAWDGDVVDIVAGFRHRILPKETCDPMLVVRVAVRYRHRLGGSSPLTGGLRECDPAATLCFVRASWAADNPKT